MALSLDLPKIPSPVNLEMIPQDLVTQATAHPLTEKIRKLTLQTTATPAPHMKCRATMARSANMVPHQPVHQDTHTHPQKHHTVLDLMTIVRLSLHLDKSDCRIISHQAPLSRPHDCPSQCTVRPSKHMHPHKPSRNQCICTIRFHKYKEIGIGQTGDVHLHGWAMIGRCLLWALSTAHSIHHLRTTPGRIRQP